MAGALVRGLGAAFAVLVLGCGSDLSAIQVHTGDQTGCRPERVKMGTVYSFRPAGQPDTSPVNQNALWWYAACRGKRFSCTGQLDGYVIRDVVCKAVERMSAAPAVPVRPAAPGPSVGGCDYDTQCKGERLCIRRQCVDPPASAPK